MNASYGKIKACLAEPINKITDELIGLINQNIKPPQPVSAEDVFVRAMFVVSDEINSFGGRFPADEHSRLASLLIDSPVLVGHRKDKLPIGRNFYAALIAKDGRQWVKSYFYWLKSSDGAESLRENIDGGIYKECSIGFTYLYPECSVCGNDIRRCEHQPLQRLVINGAESTIHFNYRQIERVLETSLVYRGALPDTSVSKELILSKTTSPVSIKALSEIKTADSYLVTPCYEALAVLAEFADDSLIVKRLDGTKLHEPSNAFKEVKNLPKLSTCYAHLIGYRGKQRCELAHLEKFIAGKSSSITHLELKLFPNDSLQLVDREVFCDGNKISSIRHVICNSADLVKTASALATRDGVLIWPISDGPPSFAGYRYRPDGNDSHYATFQIFQSGGPENVRMIISDQISSRSFVIRQFNINRLKHGARFVAESLTETEIQSAQLPLNSNGRVICKGSVESVSKIDDGYMMQLAGGFNGCFILQPIKLEGELRFLFYAIDNGNLSGNQIAPHRAHRIRINELNQDSV